MAVLRQSSLPKISIPERLLKAEAGRLRVQLEGKGLKVDGILVEREGP